MQVNAEAPNYSEAMATKKILVQGKVRVFWVSIEHPKNYLQRKETLDKAAV
jgi:hypothetical protein